MLSKVITIATAYWPLKVLSLAIAVAIWSYAGSRLKEEAILWVPVKVNVPENFTVLYQSHQHVQVRFTGPQFLIQRRQEEARQNYLEFNARLTEQDIAEGAAELTLSSDWLNIPEAELVRMNAEAIEPSAVQLHASRIVERTMKVEPRITGRPAGGYEVADHAVTPPDVLVKGPAVVLDRMETIKTHPVSVWEARQDIRRDVQLVKEQDFTLGDGKNISVTYRTSVSQVGVHVSVERQHAEKRIENVQVQFLKPVDFQYKVEVPPDEKEVDVIVSGPPDRIRDIGPARLTAYVDLKELEQEEVPADTTAPYKQSVKIVLDPQSEAVVRRVIPDQITLLLSAKN